MASGLPVIAPRRGGPVDLVSPSRTGWLYTPGMLDELRDRATDLLFDDAKRRAFGRAAEDSVRKRTWPVLAEQLRGCYLQAIEQHGRAAALLCPAAGRCARRRRAAPAHSATQLARRTVSGVDWVQSSTDGPAHRPTAERTTSWRSALVARSSA